MIPKLGEFQQRLDERSAREAMTSDDLAGLHPAVAAVSIFCDTLIETQEICRHAEARVAARSPRIHTFAPLYTTNHCDSQCKMCGMRKGNLSLERKFAGKKLIEDQLRILRDSEHLRGVGILTGEYESEFARLANAFRVGWITRTALDMGFERVYLNIGSLSPVEVDVLGEWFDTDAPVTLCVFQETFNEGTYEKFMGRARARFSGDIEMSPKANYDQRLASFDHWLDAGFKYVNQGLLVGLDKDIVEEMFRLVWHANYLATRGAVVDISLPRLRPAMGVDRNASGIDDDAYLRMMATIALVCPQHRLVLTTREREEFQKRAMSLCGVFSPGSPDVAPYKDGRLFENSINSSQFIVADQRRPSEVLRSAEELGYRISHFEDPMREARV